MRIIIALIAFIYGYANMESQVYSNPVVNEDFSTPDVCIWNKHDTYYMFYTSPFVRNYIYISKNLIDWKKTEITPFDTHTLEQIKELLENSNKFDNYMLWAPFVMKIGKKWNMYFSLKNRGGIIVLQSDTPTGPFRFIGEPKILISNEMMGWAYDAIDPFVVKDRGKLWIFFGSAFGVYRGRLNEDGLSLHKKNKFVHVAGPTSPNQLVDGKRHGGYEGTYIYKHKNYWYLIVSKRTDYSLYAGRSKKITGDFIDVEGKRLADGYGTRMNYPTEGFKSPGHNGEIFKDKNDRYFIFYHARTKDIPGSKYGLRQVVLSELEWIDGFPYIKGRKVQKHGNIAPVF